MSRYKIVGSALNPPAEVPSGLPVGAEIDLDLERDRERALIGAGVIVKTQAKPKPAKDNS